MYLCLLTGGGSQALPKALGTESEQDRTVKYENKRYSAHTDIYIRQIYIYYICIYDMHLDSK